MVVGRRVDTLHTVSNMSASLIVIFLWKNQMPEFWDHAGKKVLHPFFNICILREYCRIRITSLQVQGCITNFQLDCHLTFVKGVLMFYARVVLETACICIWKQQDTPGPSNAKSELLLKGTLTWRVVKTDLSLKPSMPRLWPASSTSENMHYTFLRETTFRDILLISPFGFCQHFQTPFEKQIKKLYAYHNHC